MSVIIKPSARKSLREFHELFDVKHKNSPLRLGCEKKAQINQNSLYVVVNYSEEASTHKKNTYKKALYDSILQNPQVVQSPISNYYLKVSIGDQSENRWFQMFYYSCLSEKFIKT